MPGLFSSRRSELISNEGRQMEAEAIWEGIVDQATHLKFPVGD